jgi:catechol 2,3-dioxygenase-like lactoylglutathione lyase family enzyme
MLWGEGEPTMSIRLDHANLNVRDVDETVRFLTTAFPEFRIRAEGKKWNGDRWLHVGTDHVYLALTQARSEATERWIPYGAKPGTNHLGFEVDDVVSLRRRLAEAGYRDTTVPNDHPYRRRVYFADRDGNDWEFVEYLSDDPRKRHDYALPDGS